MWVLAEMLVVWVLGVIVVMLVRGAPLSASMVCMGDGVGSPRNARGTAGGVYRFNRWKGRRSGQR